MASCATCGSTIVFGGVKESGMQFCNQKCFQASPLVHAIAGVPQDLVEQHARALFEAPCPRCGGPGPVDVRFNHRITSVVYLSWWKTNASICCAKCGRKEQIGSLLYCTGLGWWGFPWGILGTPIQIGRNIVEMSKGKKAEPSEALRLHVRQHLATQIPPPAPPTPYVRVPGSI